MLQRTRYHTLIVVATQMLVHIVFLAGKNMLPQLEKSPCSGINSGWPHIGVVADCMRRTRAAYHYAIRSIRKNQKAIVLENMAKCITDMAKCITENRNRDFWHEIRKIKGSSKNVSSVVDGLTESSDIANLFADIYDDLYTCVPYDRSEMDSVVELIEFRLDSFSNDCVIQFNDVAEAISGLKSAKRDAFAGLSTGHFINDRDE